MTNLGPLTQTATMRMTPHAHRRAYLAYKYLLGRFSPLWRLVFYFSGCCPYSESNKKGPRLRALYITLLFFVPTPMRAIYQARLLFRPLMRTFLLLDRATLIVSAMLR